MPDQVYLRQVGFQRVHWAVHRKRIVDAIGPDVIKYLNDFETSPLIAADTPIGWTVTKVEAGAAASTITFPDAVGGALLLTTDSNENDGISMQLDGESFELTTDQHAVYFGIRFQCSEATQIDWFLGLAVTDTDPLGGVTDGVYFRKVDGSTDIKFVVEKNSTETESASLGTFAAATDIFLEFYYIGATSSGGPLLQAFIDGVQVGGTIALTNLPDDEALTPTIQVLAGSAASRTMQIDLVRTVQIGR